MVIRCSRVVGEKLEPADNARVIPTSQFTIVFVVVVFGAVEEVGMTQLYLLGK